MRTVLLAGTALFCFASVALAETVNICGVGRSEEADSRTNVPAANTGAQACECRNLKLTYEPNAKASEDRSELSGVVLMENGKRLITISNEGVDPENRDHVLQIFEGDPEHGYVFKQDVPLFQAPEGLCNEADFEALTRHDGDVFAVTSHSRDRKKQDDDSTYEENRKRLTAKGIGGCPWRYQLKRFRLSESDEVSQVQDANLLAMIVNDPVLAPFAALPNKENGVDIEGLAATKKSLYVGFKGPVLRQNYVPVLRLGFDLLPDGREPNPLFVNLGGRGIRDLTAAPDDENLYILAGPTGDETQSFAIYFWDGEDQVGRGSDFEPEKNERCRLGTFDKVKPEGIVYLDSDESEERFLLVFDGGDTPTARIVALKKTK